MRPIVLDFETYYDKDYSLKKLGIYRYVLDPRFKVFGLAVWDSLVTDGSPAGWVPPEGIASFLEGLTRPVVHHNAPFDALILDRHYGWRASQTIDTIFLANHYFGPAKETGKKNDLATVATRLGLEPKGKPDFMKGVRDPDEAQLLALAAYARQDVKLTWQVYERLIPHLSRPERELWLIDHTIRLFVDRPLRVDKARVEAEITNIGLRRDAAVALAGVPRTVLASGPQFAAELKSRLAATGTKMPMKRGKNGTIPALAKGDPGFVKLARTGPEPVRNLIAARMAEKSSAVAQARLQKMLDHATTGLPVHLAYYGAHTGRFAGAGGFNLQNLTDPGRAPDDDARQAAEATRASILPPPGRAFASSDAAQIEARITPWLAGEESLLTAFREGRDVYSEFISDVLGETIRKPKDDDAPEVRDRMGLMRQVGKGAVLGLGFSMGGVKFLATLKRTPAIMAKIESGEIDNQFVAKVLYGYRDKYTKIVRLWDRYDDAFRKAMVGATSNVGPIIFGLLEPGIVYVKLPSGRRLYYHNVHEVPRSGKVSYVNREGETVSKAQRGTEIVYGFGKAIHRVYGGMLTENIVQAVARDVLADSMFTLEDQGHPISLHIHDSITLTTPRLTAKRTLGILDKVLATTPSWAPGLPLASEGKVTLSLAK